MQARPFGRFYKFVAVFYGHGGRHFHGNVFSAHHGVASHFGVCAPWGTDINKVYFAAGAHFFPAVFAMKFFYGRAVCFCYLFFGGVYVVFVQVGYDIVKRFYTIFRFGNFAPCMKAYRLMARNPRLPIPIMPIRTFCIGSHASLNTLLFGVIVC